MDESSLGAQQFNQFVVQVKNDLKSKGIVSKDDRKAIYDVDETIPQRSSEIVAHLTSALDLLPDGDAKTAISEALKSARETHQLAAQRNELISPMETRNKTKRADLWAYQQAIINVTKAAMITLNHIDGMAMPPFFKTLSPSSN